LIAGVSIFDVYEGPASPPQKIGGGRRTLQPREKTLTEVDIDASQQRSSPKSPAGQELYADVSGYRPLQAKSAARRCQDQRRRHDQDAEAQKTPWRDLLPSRRRATSQSSVAKEPVNRQIRPEVDADQKRRVTAAAVAELPPRWRSSRPAGCDEIASKGDQPAGSPGVPAAERFGACCAGNAASMPMTPVCLQPLRRDEQPATRARRPRNVCHDRPRALRACAPK